MSGKVLIADDVATNRIVLKVKLGAAFYETTQAASGTETIAAARANRPDLILLDVEMPDMNGIDVCRQLKADPATRDIPVVMVTAFRDMERKMAALGAGADEVFWKPIDEVVLLARLRSILRAREAAAELGLRQHTYRDLGFAEPAEGFVRPAKVALVLRDAATRGSWAGELRPYLSDQLVVMEPDEALTGHAGGAAADVFVIGADLAEPGGGLRLMSELRSRHGTRHAAICIVLTAGVGDTAAMALDLGANDLIEAGADPAEIALRIRMQVTRKRQADRLRESLEDRLRLAMTDPLTGLHNRRYATANLGRMAERAAETGRSFALMVLDLDRFKAINDTHGHAAGDCVLSEVARRLAARLRPVDLLARIGGEEFLVALPDMGLAEASRVAERLRLAVSDRQVALPHGLGALSVTCSIGLAISDPGAGRAGIEELFHRADRALLAAKLDGRNQVSFGKRAA